jgi:hypothetical protein
MKQGVSQQNENEMSDTLQGIDSVIPSARDHAMRAAPPAGSHKQRARQLQPHNLFVKSAWFPAAGLLRGNIILNLLDSTAYNITRVRSRTTFQLLPTD